MRDATLWIDSAAQLRALASPVRQEIADLLAAAGPASIADVADHLGRPADGLYFHFRRLLKARLLVELPPRRSGRHVAALYDVAGRPLRIRHASAPTASVRKVLHAALRLGMRDLTRALGQPYATTEGPGQTLWSGRFKGWVTAAQTRRINALMNEILTILQAGRPGRDRSLRSMTFVLAPTPPSPRAARKRKGETR